MNQKTALGLVAIVILIGLAFLVFGGKHVPDTIQIPFGATSTPTAATSTDTTEPVAAAPAQVSGVTKSTTAVAQPVATPAKNATFDQLTFTSTSSHPVITGKANIRTITIVLNDPNGVGIAGSYDVSVEDGHWSWSAPLALAPGNYTLILAGGDNQVTAKLIVSGS